MNRREFLVSTLSATVLYLRPNIILGEPEEKEKACYLYDDIYLRHDTGKNHPESPMRLQAIHKAVKKANVYKDLFHIEAKETDLDIVSLVHDMKYIKKVQKECKSGRKALSTGDTAICEESYSIALQAVGGILSAVDTVFTKKAKNAFCAVRPPGHHASQKRGMGFCIFNNAAIAARYAQKKHKIERVLIADWDVHHGNGTQDVFYEDNTVFFMSTHQSPWYPWTGRRDETGKGKGKGFTMNRPFPAGSGNTEIIGAFKDDLFPAAIKFKPELIIISAGFDSREGDPLGRFRIDDKGFRKLTKIMLEIANIAGDGKLLSILEGGYNLKGLSAAVLAHVDEISKA